LLLGAGCGSDNAPGTGPDPILPGELDAVSDAVLATDSATLFSFLQDRSYKSMLAEPAVHESDGPHGDVRVFINQRLAISLQNGSDEHPVGSSAVKELYASGTLRGWAVEVKTAAGQGGAGWYWYENFSVSDNDPVVDGQNVGLCTGCHEDGGDYVTIPAAIFGL